MFVRRVEYKTSTYYYLARKIPGTDKHAFLAKLGSLDALTPHQEDLLLKSWATSLIYGTEQSLQKNLEREKLIAASKASECGRTFDLDQCLTEFRAVYKKYDSITKTLLEKTARPTGD